MKAIISTLVFFAMIFVGFSCVQEAEQKDERPAEWAQPIELSGVPNCFKVSENLYRSAQPTLEGMKALKMKGVKTIVNLRSFHSDRDETEEAKLAYEHIFMKAWHPEEKEVVRFLRIVTNPSQTPVLVHCQHGADRTGTMCALYRVAVQGWSKDKALDEMKNGEYGFHEAWVNLENYIDDLDVQSIKKQAGLAEPEEPETAEGKTATDS